ncbi:MAG TPA: VWA domain-containing protein [Solirubrobacterales bacterium]|nr:VWA domain-containing protein [Solirubrobacterales bacterium]
MSSYEDESFPATPFVLVVDQSESMQSNDGIETVNRELAELVNTLSAIPEVEETASIGLISFAERATVHRRIEPIINGIELPTFEALGATSFAAPLEALRSLIASDVPRLSRRGRRPIAFFITDGRPNYEKDKEWRAARARLLEPGFRLRPKLVTMGCGSVERECLEELASTPELAQWEAGPTQSALEAILQTVTQTIITLSGDPEPGDDFAGRIFRFDYEVGEDEVIEYGDP